MAARAEIVFTRSLWREFFNETYVTASAFDSLAKAMTKAYADAYESVLLPEHLVHGQHQSQASQAYKAEVEAAMVEPPSFFSRVSL